MVVQMLLCLHGIHAETPLNGRICENIRTIVIIHHIVGNVLNNRRGLFVIDKSRRLDDEFLRIIFKLIEHTRLNALQNLNDSLAGEPGFLHQLSDQIIFHICADRFGTSIACRLLFYKGSSRCQRFL